MNDNKRFKGFYVENVGWSISDCISHIDYLFETQGDVIEFLNILNNLHEDLMSCHSYLSSKTTVEDRNEKLYKENEQLKLEMDNLFNYFAKWFESERGVYIEEFIEFWENIKKGS